jgi:predicted PurR-regulated permease PerM
MGPKNRPPRPDGPIWGPRVGWFAGLVFLAIVAYVFRGFALPLLLALPLAYLLHPLVSRLEALGMRRSLAVTGVFTALALLALVAGFLLGPRLSDEAARVTSTLPPLVEQSLTRAAADITASYPRVGQLLPAIPQQDGWLVDLLAKRFTEPTLPLRQLGMVALLVVLAPIIAFFLLKDAARAFNHLIERLRPHHIETSLAVWCEIDRITGRYLRGIALESAAVGTLATAGLWLLGVPYPLLLGLLSALVNPVPYLGALFSLLIACLVALTAGMGATTVVSLILLFAAIRVLDDTVIVLLTVGASVRLHPLLVLASIVAGEQAFGVVGMVLAVPTVTVAKEVMLLVLEHRRTQAAHTVPDLAAPRSPSPYLC